ncbi:MAG TPA: thioredoxin domain-containing protein [Tepidisphaeraceae bacterium]|nr:thioredoxin domain-containing protein [Tepidisphaeraceae bacterium]
MKLDLHAPRLAVPVTENDHAQGPPDAPVTLVEYGDYECPYCGRAHPLVQELRRRLGDRLRFVFRNFPLNTIHQHAGVAAQAAEAAGVQGKFWEMHDLLYDHQSDLADADLQSYALKLELEPYQFSADLSSERFAKRVREDFRGGVRSGVNGTPTFFINGTRYNGPHELAAMLEAIEAAARQDNVG